MHEFRYDYVKVKYGEKVKLCYMDIDRFIIYVKTDDFCKHMAEDVETRLGTSNYELERSLLKGENKKVIGVMKDELDGKIMKEFVGLRAKTYSYLTNGGSEAKEGKGTKMCVIKENLNLKIIKTVQKQFNFEIKIDHLEKDKTNLDSIKEDHKECIKSNKLILKTQQRFRSEKHNVFTENINKIALTSNDGKIIIQPIDLLGTYEYGTKEDLVYKKEEIKCNNIKKKQYKNV